MRKKKKIISSYWMLHLQLLDAFLVKIVPRAMSTVVKTYA